MSWVDLNSTLIKRAKWDDALFIDFHKGGVYRYDSAPKSVYMELVRSGSPGRFFHSSIKGDYHGTKE